MYSNCDLPGCPQDMTSLGECGAVIKYINGRSYGNKDRFKKLWAKLQFKSFFMVTGEGVGDVLGSHQPDFPQKCIINCVYFTVPRARGIHCLHLLGFFFSYIKCHSDLS